MWKKLFGPRTPEAYAEKAVDALDRGDGDGALVLMQECVQKFPDVAESRLFHSDILSMLGRHDEAAATMDAVANRYPTTVWMQKAKVFECAQRLPEALEAYEAATRSDGSYVDAWLGWAAALDRGGDHDQSVDKLARARELAPDRPDLHLALGHAFRGLDGRLADALTHYEKALELGERSAHPFVRSTLLELGRVSEANQRRLKRDPQGEARERRKSLSSRALVARYFTGQHSKPELLDAVVEHMLDHLAKLEGKPPGLANGITIQYAWPVLRIWDDGTDLVVCEPDWANESQDRARAVVSFSAMQLVMTQIVHDITGAEPEQSSCLETMVVERGALDSKRVLMIRSEPTKEGDSGWRVRCTPDAEFTAAELPMTALVALRPHLLKVVTLPTGWTVHMHEETIEGVFDAEGIARFDASRDT